MCDCVGLLRFVSSSCDVTLWSRNTSEHHITSVPWYWEQFIELLTALKEHVGDHGPVPYMQILMQTTCFRVTGDCLIKTFSIMMRTVNVLIIQYIIFGHSDGQADETNNSMGAWLVFMWASLLFTIKKNSEWWISLNHNIYPYIACKFKYLNLISYF